MCDITIQMGANILLALSLAYLLPATVLLAPLDQQSDSDKVEFCKTEDVDGRLTIDCSEQQLSELPPGLNLEARVLLLANNNFASFPPEIAEFTELEELSLAGNHLNGPLPIFLENLRSLALLNLSNNNFDSWENSDLESLTRLDVSKNKIINVSETAFSGMKSLNHLDFSENRINQLPHNLFMNINTLDTLVLARNQFDKFPNFRSFSLKNLDLSNCQIATLEFNSFFGKSSLYEVNLSINEIDSIPDNIASSTVQILDLSYNNISSLSDSTFSSLPHLAVLDLRGNDFKEVWSTSHFNSNPFLREMKVKGNRWNCEGFDINLLLTYEFLTREPSRVSDPDTTLICYSPANVTQLTWRDAYLQTWHQESGYGPFTMSAIIFGVIIGVVITSFACRGLMSITKPDSPRVIIREVETQNLNPQTSTDSEPVVMRVPLTEDLPPTYDEALLMPKLNSFHSLPGLVDEEEEEERSPRRFRRSRSIGDLVDSPRRTDRRSVVRSPRTVQETEELVR